MPYEILTLGVDHPRYAEIIQGAAADPRLCDQMWDDAELEWELDVDTRWTVAYDVNSRSIMAMAAFRPEVVDGEIGWLCRANYHFRLHRSFAWYPVAFMARHLLTRTRPCLTHVYRQPKPIHEAAGWRTTNTGVSSPEGYRAGHPHRWYEMRREADPS